MSPEPMSDDEKFEVLELWHRMNDEQKAAALRVLEMFEAENKAEDEAKREAFLKRARAM